MRDALTHTRPTGYDRSGACIAMLPAGERKRRFREAYLAECVAQVERSKKGGKDLRSCDEKSTDAWNAILGPSFTPKQTYAMVNKKFGPAVAKSFKPKARRPCAGGVPPARPRTLRSREGAAPPHPTHPLPHPPTWPAARRGHPRLASHLTTGHY